MNTLKTIYLLVTVTLSIAHVGGLLNTLNSVQPSNPLVHSQPIQLTGVESIED